MKKKDVAKSLTQRQGDGNPGIPFRPIHITNQSFQVLLIPLHVVAGIEWRTMEILMRFDYMGIWEKLFQQ